MNGGRELTWTSLLLGVILSVVFGAANAYLGLRVGLTVSASIPAAVVSMGVMRFLLKRDSPLENNMVQTIGSAGESLAAGVIFTMPALYLWADAGLIAPPGFWSLTVVALAGGVLGALFMIPLRKPLIEDEDKTLAYPEGRACVEVIKAGTKGASGAMTVVWGFAASAVLKFTGGFLKWIPESVTLPLRALRGEIGLEFSSALGAVGFIVGPKVSALLFSGSALGWLVLIPAFSAFSPDAAAAWSDGGASAVWRGYIRYVGAGAIAAGGFLSLVKSVPLFIRTFRASLGKAQLKSNSGDISIGKVIVGIVATVVILAALPIVPVGLGGVALVALFGFFFAAVSARMVGFVGSSNNPVSGMAIATLVVSALVLKTCGVAGAAGMVAAMTIGSIVCIVAAMAGDMAQDLKTGYLLGATPWRQQIGEFVGASAAALAIVGVLLLLHRAWGFGSGAIPAPQATLMKVIVEGIMGGTLPWNLLLIGAALAFALALFRVPVMPFAIGLYLPISMMSAIFLGGLVKLFVERRFAAQIGGGTLLSAGLIAGEGICGLLIAVLVLLWK